jgi:hypothetical protein
VWTFPDSSEDLSPEKESVDEDAGPDRDPSEHLRINSFIYVRLVPTDAHRDLRFEDEGSRMLSRIETAPLVGRKISNKPHQVNDKLFK